MLLVAEQPAADLVTALSTAGAFPVVEAKWADAATAFAAVRPASMVIAEPGPAPDESLAHALSLQIANADGPIVPVIARVEGDQDPALPIALPNDAALPVERLIARLRSVLRVRALHATVLRRIETFDSRGATLPELPVGDALDDATVLIAGRGRLYPALSVAIGERFGMVGALSVETAARHLSARDIDGIVVGDGLPARKVEAFLTVLAQDGRYRDIPVAVIGETPPIFAETLPNIDHVTGDPARVVGRMVPLVRLHAFERRLKRVLASLEAGGIIDSATGLLTHDAFWQELAKAVAEASDRSQALTLARLSFDGPIDERSSLDVARMLTRLTRNIDFATRDTDGEIMIAFTQTDLPSAHVIARRIATTLKNTILAPHGEYPKIAANLTLATLKAGDTLDSLMRRVMGLGQVVAAE